MCLRIRTVRRSVSGVNSRICLASSSTEYRFQLPAISMEDGSLRSDSPPRSSYCSASYDPRLWNNVEAWPVGIKGTPGYSIPSGQPRGSQSGTRGATLSPRLCCQATRDFEYNLSCHPSSPHVSASIIKHQTCRTREILRILKGFELQPENLGNHRHFTESLCP